VRVFGLADGRLDRTLQPTAVFGAGVARRTAGKHVPQRDAGAVTQRLEIGRAHRGRGLRIAPP
jgi:hypothetical protein